MLFDHCATCQRCCHVDPGFPPLEVTLTREEKKGLGSVCIENSCEHLGDAGCTLGDAKPLSCKLYPLAFNPKTKAFFFDIDCPLMPMYESQLQDPDSEASNHLRQMSEAVKGLSKSDPQFLTANYRVDSYYFDLAPLLHNGASKKTQA
jgi:Fe-S-cluster containining protein